MDLFREKRGCLYGKTEDEKKSFFISLSNFAITNKMFFEEQYWDLLPDERKEFENWIAEDVAQKKQLKALVDLIGKLLEEKHGK